ncbi:MAG: EAL domain-containing protein [Candidatus Limnocylindrales bacterium]
MAPEHLRSAARWPSTLGGRAAGLLVAAAGLLAVYAAVRCSGGAPNPLTHFAYLAILLAALAGGWPGGLLAGLAAGLLLGPLMPDSTAASPHDLEPWGWALRLLAFAAAGVVVGCFWERSERLAAQAAARAAEARGEAVRHAGEARLRHALEAAADGLLVFDAAGRLSFANAAAERLLGAPRDQLLGTTYEALAAQVGLAPHPGSREDPAPPTATRPGGAPLAPALLTLRASDGTRRSLEVRGQPLLGEGAAGGLVYSLHEVTAARVLARERSAHLAQLQAAAQAAAGAPSAAAAAEALLALVARIRPVVAVAIYLFDAQGTQRLAGWSAPEAGEPIPPLVPSADADALRGLAAQGPLRTELARLPGSGAGAALLAARGAHALLVLPLVDAGRLVGTLLAGERGAPEPLGPDEAAHLRAIGGLAAGIVRRAVADEEAARRRQRERLLAVLATPEHLVPVYQPILDLGTRRVVGYEALARFRVEPLAPPDRWFAQAAAVGLGVELQALAIERERRGAAAAGLPAGTFLSLNVSPRYLPTPAVAAALDGARLDRLVIEVTEEEAVADYGALRHAMAPYLARGARVAVDDAGAGYASMRHVTELRPAFVKLDAALIRGLHDDTARQALVAALVSFSAAIAAVPIAEGVESPADLALLARTHRPLLAQGYAIGRPGPAWPAVAPAALGFPAARRPRTLQAVPEPAPL